MSYISWMVHFILDIWLSSISNLICASHALKHQWTPKCCVSVKCAQTLLNVTNAGKLQWFKTTGRWRHNTDLNTVHHEPSSVITYVGVIQRRPAVLLCLIYHRLLVSLLANWETVISFRSPFPAAAILWDALLQVKPIQSGGRGNICGSPSTTPRAVFCHVA